MPSDVPPALQTRVVGMMKAGRALASIYNELVSQGVHGEEARRLIDGLVVLKQRAEALDPERLRRTITTMLWGGTPSEAVVAHLASLGVGETDARAEVLRIGAELPKLQACDGCRGPLEPSKSYFDEGGRQVCTSCHSQREIARQQQRVFEGALDAVGIAPWVVQASNAYGAPTVPYCSRCNAYSGVHVAGLSAQDRMRLHPAATVACGRCWTALR